MTRIAPLEPPYVVASTAGWPKPDEEAQQILGQHSGAATEAVPMKQEEEYDEGDEDAHEAEEREMERRKKAENYNQRRINQMIRENRMMNAHGHSTSKDQTEFACLW